MDPRAALTRVSHTTSGIARSLVCAIGEVPASGTDVAQTLLSVRGLAHD
jgi:hypothetical protein